MESIEVFKPGSKRKIETVLGLMMAETSLIGEKLSITLTPLDVSEPVAAVEVDPTDEHYVALSKIDEKLGQLTTGE
jgi:hypothetical protein